MDPWSTLGVARGTSPDEIKQAYRKLAMKHHPDRGGNTEEFQKIQQAYDDITSGRADQPQPPPGGAWGGPNEQWFDFGAGPFAFHFGQNPHFGQGFGRQQRRYEDANVEYPVTLEDLYHGKKDRIRIMKPDRSGVIEMDLNIDRGMASNVRIRYPGANTSPISNIIPGDVYVTLVTSPHPQFRRDGDDLLIEKYISVFDAMLGNPVEVQTLDGRQLQMKVPPGARPGLRLRVAGAGMPRYNNSSNFGDLYVQLNIRIPALEGKDLERKLVDLIQDYK
jgi:curved DNA-binding protein